MYQFTTTTIINSALDSNGTTAKYSATATALTVTRVGKFLSANVLSVYKRAYHAGVKEIAHITVPTITQGLVARLTIDVRLSQQTDSEYASAYLYFKKPVTVEVIATGTPATDTTNLVAAINSLRDRYGFAYVTAVDGTANAIYLTATNFNQRFYNVKIESEVALTLNSNSIIQPEYTDVTAGTFHVATAGKLGFGDDDWMAQHIMLPTAENVRYFGTNKEERPVLGGNYSEYALRYSITKEGNDGIVSGSTSVTTHIFYVLSSLVPYFEAVLYTAGIAVTSVASEQTFTLTATDDGTAAVKVDISAIVPFIMTTGEITATSGTVANGTIGAITIATPTGTPPVQTARIVITKVQAGATVISVTIDGVTKTVTATIG